MAFHHLETTLQRLHHSRFIRRPEGRLLVISAIPLLKTSLKRLRPSRFFDVRDAGNQFKKAFDKLKFTSSFLQSRFLRSPEGRL
jgi:hypothetical protein